MNILLIGSRGYIGRGLEEYLRHNHIVIGWDKDENIFNLTPSILAKKNIEMVINLSLMADRHSKNYQIDTPGDEVNVFGARHLARALKGSEITWFQFSTREVLGPVYGRNDVIKTKGGYRPKFLVDETFPYFPINSYGKSKVIAEFIAESHPYSNIIRLTTGYTDYNNPGGWVIQLVKAVAEGNPVKLTNGGEQFRDPLHTDDIARLMEQIHERKIYGEKFHAGGGSNNIISLKEFVRIVSPTVTIEKMEGGDFGFAFENGKAKNLVGWEPQVLVREKIPIILKNVLSK